MSNNESIFETLKAQKELIDANPTLASLRQDLFRVMRSEQDRSKLTPAQFAMEPIHPVVKARFDILQRGTIEHAIAKEKEGK